MTITPTQPPALPTDVFGVGRPPILVTGAHGVLGSAVIRELNESLIPSRAFVRSAKPTPAAATFHGDIATGAGLDEALDGVGAVIHCATDPRAPERVDVGGTRNLLASLDAWAPTAHVVLPSIVGCWENPLGYYRAKADAENLVEGWAGRASIVRATQFHHLLRRAVSGRAAHVTGASTTIRCAPIDPDWVARKLVDVALMRLPLPLPIELAGPETLSLADYATLTAHLDSRRPRRALPLPTGWGSLKAFSHGSNLPAPTAQRGGAPYGTWLAQSQGFVVTG